MPQDALIHIGRSGSQSCDWPIEPEKGPICLLSVLKNREKVGRWRKRLKNEDVNKNKGIEPWNSIAFSQGINEGQLQDKKHEKKEAGAKGGLVPRALPSACEGTCAWSKD